MVKKIREEDYFAATTMTFGEHLEELRKVLVRAVLGLAVGFLLGLYVAPHVVSFIQSPLEQALARYYLNRNMAEMKNRWGVTPSEDAENMFKKWGLVSEYLFLEKPEGQRIFKEIETPAQEKPQKSKGTRSKRPADAQNKDEELDLAKLASSMTAPNPNSELILVRFWKPVRADIKALNAQEAFMIWLKAAFLVGAVLASPYVFLQIWTFIAAGLYPHEQKYVYMYMPFSLGLFLAGAGMAFFFVFRPVLDFLFTFNASMRIDPDPRISEWIGFVLVLPLGFGIAFQLPLVMLFLNRLGIFSTQAYLDKWRIAVLVIFVVAMFLTPADPVSMLLMAVPLTFLYFCGIALCVWMPKINSNVIVES